jgi:hypothetical protein
MENNEIISTTLAVCILKSEPVIMAYTFNSGTQVNKGGY